MHFSMAVNVPCWLDIVWGRNDRYIWLSSVSMGRSTYYSLFILWRFKRVPALLGISNVAQQDRLDHGLSGCASIGRNPQTPGRLPVTAGAPNTESELYWGSECEATSFAGFSSTRPYGMGERTWERGWVWSSKLRLNFTPNNLKNLVVVFHEKPKTNLEILEYARVWCLHWGSTGRLSLNSLFPIITAFLFFFFGQII